MDYAPRHVDAELDSALRRAGAVLIEGPKACGKTATALQRAASVSHVDTDPGVAQLMEIDPALVLDGAAPRLLDEWQWQPRLWDSVRRAVDERHAPGQFILTGSSAPSVNATRHSGAGRFARLRMRTMTLVETGHSTGVVSFAGLIADDPPRAAAQDLGYLPLLERIARGGWPAFQDLTIEDALANLRDYVQAVAEVDVQLADGVARDPIRVRRLLAALARSTATEASISTLARDEASLSRDAVRAYLAALERIFVVEDQPAWSAHLRSSATLRKEPKRHFCDPALAVALLRADPSALRNDAAFAGQLFESLVVHELRIYAQQHGGSVFHARDSAGREVDAIVQGPDSTWHAFEVKLGSADEVVERAAAGLLRFAAVAARGESRPTLTVITGSGPSYRRSDGVNVVAVSALGP
ncbi:ATP-binding protein [Agromyces marinus]|uniref:ATPase AAA n=1 Tax=Agromyces marinus TaxID=1389020 RepID=A0ABN6YEK4_9MICO|nr:DUF4143 domain-containing protein [Agromyces marinus]UIP57499.1 hypothetical protein DSM26151_03600 [Agromyces marinus]BDZ54365.1 ATPase AAA [Agromyces marinus]